MFLRNLRIENIRGVDKVELSFENGTNGGIRPWTVFLGVNGSSKSTILRSVALALAGSDALPALLADVDSWIRLGATRGRIEAVVQTAEGDKRELRLELRKGDGISAVLRRNEEGLSLLDRAIAHAPRNYLRTSLFIRVGVSPFADFFKDLKQRPFS